MLFIRLIETIIARIAIFLIQLIFTKDSNESNFDEFNFNEVFNKIRLAKKTFL